MENQDAQAPSGSGRTQASEARLRVLIAGGGVAALEALLAIRAGLGDRAEIELMAPSPEFVFRPLLVAEPFGLATALRLDLEQIAREHGASFRWDALTAVDAAAHRVSTAEGKELDYDALLLAIGARPVPITPGALTFGDDEGRRSFGELLGRLSRNGDARLVIAVPRAVKWPIAAYELALLTAAHLAARDASGVRVTIVTHEGKPLGLLGSSAPRLVEEMLAEQGVELRTSSAPLRFGDGILEVEDGDGVPADEAVALPGLEVPPIPGVPQRTDGFIPTDIRMNVEGTSRIWAAGDATWFPIKQGGLATQQAEVAATGIIGLGGGRVSEISFRPTLRAALLTGALPRYFLAEVWDGEHADASAASLWWPPGKIAGRHLTPYLTGLLREEPVAGTLRDLSPQAATPDEAADAETLAAAEFALAAADADARDGDFAGALEWLQTVEELTLTLPPAYSERRRDWARAAGARPPAEVITR